MILTCNQKDWINRKIFDKQKMKMSRQVSKIQQTDKRKTPKKKHTEQIIDHD